MKIKQEIYRVVYDGVSGEYEVLEEREEVDDIGVEHEPSPCKGRFRDKKKERSNRVMRKESRTA